MRRDDEERERDMQSETKAGRAIEAMSLPAVDNKDTITSHLALTYFIAKSLLLWFCDKMLSSAKCWSKCLRPPVVHPSKTCVCVIIDGLPALLLFPGRLFFFSWFVLWWNKSSLSSEDKRQVMVEMVENRASSWWRLSWVRTQRQTVSPREGHEKKSRGITRVFPPKALPSVSPPPSPPLPLHPHLFAYIPGALFFLLGSILRQRERKWNCFLGSIANPLGVKLQRAVVCCAVL